MRHRANHLFASIASAVLLLAGLGVAQAQANPYAIAPSSLHFIGAFKVGKRYVTVPHYPVTVRVQLPASVAGGTAKLTAAIGATVLRTVDLSGNAAAAGQISVRVKAPHAGVVRVKVDAVPPAGGVAYTLTASFTAVAPTDSLGATGPFVQLLQARLAALHLYIPQTGVLDQGTELALDAYHRLLGQGEGHTQVDRATVTDLLNGRGSFHVRYPSQGQHAEGDLSIQVLAFTDGSNVQLLFPISSGKPSTPTILGNFQVYYKEPNYTPDGMYFSAFFHGGYAIHGYDPAPDYPASHGCMRLPIVDAIPAYNWIQVGNWVDTYYT